MKKLLCLFLVAVFCFSLAACQSLPEESSSEPISQPSSAPETETSTSQISGGIPLDIDSNVAVKFNWLEASFVDYAEEHLGYDPIEKPVTGSGLWDILSVIEFFGYTKDDFIAVNNTFTEAFGRPEYTDEEIDILFGEDERAKRELVSPYCIFIGEGPITYETPYYTAVWYAEHSVDEWIAVGTPKEDLSRMRDRLQPCLVFDSYRKAFEEKYEEFMKRVEN